MLGHNGAILRHNTKWLGEAIPSPVPPTPSFDEVTINGLTWTAKNLDVDDGLGGVYTHTHDYGHGNVTEYYYTWDAAVRIAAKIDGWHLPSRAEWVAIAGNDDSYYDDYGKYLKSTYGWRQYHPTEEHPDGNGIDAYGFAIFPAGHRTPGESWKEIHYQAEFWTSEAQGPESAHYRMFWASDGAFKNWGYKTYAYSVRLVKDY